MLPRIRALAPLALFLALAGCGQELPAGGQREGEVSAVMTDDPGSPAPSRASNRGPRLSLTHAAVPVGTVTVDATVTLFTDRGGAQELTTAAGATVDLGSTSTTTLAQGNVSSARYTMVRIEFTKVEANVTEGLLVGPIDVRGTVRVALPTPAVVEQAIDLTVVELGHHEINIDLNSGSWLAAVDPVTLIVPSSAFRTAVTLEAHQ